MKPIFITAHSAVTACGMGSNSLKNALLLSQSMLKPARLITPDFLTYTGEIETELPILRSELSRYHSRNSRMALAALDCENAHFRAAVNAAVEKYGKHRVGTIIGTSTSGIYETERAYQGCLKTGTQPSAFNFQHQHAWVATGDFLKRELGLTGPCYAISTACSSSGKAIAAGQRLIESGICDAVVVGGVDSICHLTLHGFHSLELTAETPCKPLDRDRNGISLGEGAGLLLLERNQLDQHPALIGFGESSDAYHMTAPCPDGSGSALAMQKALTATGLDADKLDYINLHATGTRMNDQSEMQAMATIFNDQTACSGTKGITGHTLGAAGAIEAIIVLLALENGFTPGTCNIQHVDEAFKQNNIITHTLSKPDMHYVMSNNFGFGGNNVSLIFAKGELHG
ncbi:MAG: beta-ketoacyl-ACP synthase [Mariprofundus sp.]|nr:beta-ketoacyl-ACP synthase [Mariprofundus sp.]